jgi:hypothetical protein
LAVTISDHISGIPIDQHQREKSSVIVRPLCPVVMREGDPFEAAGVI